MITKKGFHISKGNMKLGGIWNFSTAVGETCAPDVPCLKACYAMKAWRLYPSVRYAWQENTDRLKAGQYEAFVDDLVTVINKADGGNPLPYFRFSVGGDIFCRDYLEAVFEVCRRCPDTKFWTYTKQYDVLSGALEDGSEVPDNLSVIISIWKDYGPGSRTLDRFARSLYDDGTVEAPEGAFVCPGSCTECKRCAETGKGDIIVFHHH